MVTINLLPWRESARMYEKKILKQYLMIAIFAAIFSMIFLRFTLSLREKVLQKNMVELKREVDEMMNLQGKMPQKDSKRKLKKWLSYHDDTQKLLIEIGKKSAADVCFKEIMRNKNTLFFTGRARSAADFTRFLQHWNAAYLFSEIKIKQIQQHADGFVQFDFEALLGQQDAI